MRTVYRVPEFLCCHMIWVLTPHPGRGSNTRLRWGGGGTLQHINSGTLYNILSLRCRLFVDCAMRSVRIHHVFLIPTARWIFMAALPIRILIANSCTRCCWIFKGLLHRLGDGRTFLKISAPHSTTYRMRLLSARSILLGRTFKGQWK